MIKNYFCEKIKLAKDSEDKRSDDRSRRYAVSIFYKRKNVQNVESMSGSTATAYGRAKALDQQDLGHYTTKSIIMPNPLIFKCE